MPETDVTWPEAASSAAVSTILFAIGSEVVSLYLRHKRVADLYEGASAVVLVVLWVYYSAQIILLGAEFTRVYAEYREGRAPPPNNLARRDMTAHPSAPQA